MTNRINIEVTLKSEYIYKDYSFSYYGTEMRIYSMEDAEGNVYVWKTSSFMYTDENEYGAIKKGDKVVIAASVKGKSEYKGQPQTVLTRVKVAKLVESSKPELTWEEKQEIKRNEQLESLGEDDFVWKMPYKQYKEHYSDCETLAGSFERNEHTGDSTIKVIIREGRLKASGVRGQKFSTFLFKRKENGKEIVRSIYAVSYQNAYKNLVKENGDANWELESVEMGRGCRVW